MTDLQFWLPRVVNAIDRWQTKFGPYQQHESLVRSDAEIATAITGLTDRLAENYPFFHPHYIGQMLKPPHEVAVLGYLATMLINPNNHALDGGPATAKMEKEVVAGLARMFGFASHLGHLTSSGTIANLEALWIAREIHPDRGIAHSADSHYTHPRMSALLRMESTSIPTDHEGRMDLDAIESELKTGRIGTIVATLGTTGLGALDPLHEIIPLARKYGARVHVDAAYGGFFTLIADDSEQGVASAPYRAIADADSVVVDPHKHGLQPYGCGALLFKDPSVGRYYKHDSPYTYFSSNELHLGEISIECSRPGAAAAALWLTLELFPLTSAGLGAVLRPGRRAALAWHAQIGESGALTSYQAPQTDIVTYLPTRNSLGEIDRVTNKVFMELAAGNPRDQIHLATYSVGTEALAVRGHSVEPDAPTARIFRSVLMKPESEESVPDLISKIAASVRKA